MTLYKNKFRIESNRWEMWDYSAPGSCFITICIYQRQEILGQIVNHKMILSKNGRIVAEHFREIPAYHQRIISDRWVIMPNHIHCIITLGTRDFNNGIADMKIKNTDSDKQINDPDPDNVENEVNGGGVINMDHMAAQLSRPCYWKRRRILAY